MESARRPSKLGMRASSGTCSDGVLVHGYGISQPDNLPLLFALVGDRCLADSLLPVELLGHARSDRGPEGKLVQDILPVGAEDCDGEEGGNKGGKQGAKDEDLHSEGDRPNHA